MKTLSLKKALLINSVFSILCAIDLLLFSSQLASIIGEVEPWMLQAVGGALVLWALDIVWVATRPNINHTLVKGIVAADIGWVFGTAVLLVGFQDVFTQVGIAILVGVALAVLVIALLQAQALSKLNADVPGHGAF